MKVYQPNLGQIDVKVQLKKSAIVSSKSTTQGKRRDRDLSLSTRLAVFSEKRHRNCRSSCLVKRYNL